MPDQRQQKIQQIIERLRGMLADEYTEYEDIARYLERAHASLTFTPAEQTQMSNAVGDANLFSGTNIVLGNVTNSTVNQQHAGRDVNAGSTHQSGGTHYGPQVAVNLGTIIYGEQPKEEQRQRLVYYLDRVFREYGLLSLRGIPNEKKSVEQLELAKVYINLATTNRTVLKRGSLAQVQPFLDNDGGLRPEYMPDSALPQTAILEVIRPQQELADAPPRERRSWASAFFSKITHHDAELAEFGPDYVLLGAKLAVEAVFDQQTCIVVGDPGSGKSVLLRFLAWDCARRNLDLAPELPPMDYLPVFLSLRKLAGALATQSTGSTTKLILDLIKQHVQDELASQPIDDFLHEALFRGKVLLLLDGLDEVPMQALPDVADRTTVIHAVKQFVHAYSYSSRIILTCRIRAYTPELAELLGWQTYTLAPFTLGQIRHYLDLFFSEYVTARLISAERKAELTTIFLNAYQENQKLADMASSPLLLTLMCQLLYIDGDLPRDRPKVYQRMLVLLLDTWDSERKQDSLAKAIGHPDWTSEYILPLIEELSFEAHKTATSSDGRGRLQRGVVYERMIDFFKQHAKNQFEPVSAADRCLTYIDQRSGIFVPDDDATNDYVFAHLTFQEHCAGRYLVQGNHPADQVMRYRHDDRWREPIFLGLGVVQETNSSLINDILTRLSEAYEHGQAKPKDRWYQDLLLACAIGADRDWDLLRIKRVTVDDIQRKLGQGLASMLANADPAIPQKLRLEAGDYLNHVGDPRPGVCDLNIQWCEIPAGTYTVGSDDRDSQAFDDEKTPQTVMLSAYAVAKYCVTNAQWRAFMQAGGYNEPHWWGNYWQIKRENQWTEPRLWDNARFNQPNQPVVGISWYEAWAFCNWLSDQLQYRVTLPNEAQWEVAARGIKRPIYPWGDEWNADYANTDATGLNRTTAVGCYPQGQSWCGAVDMSGNVWEWTVSDYNNPDLTNEVDIIKNSTLVSFRGGSWVNNPQFARVATRSWFNPHYGFNLQGLRLFRSSSQK